MVFLNFWLMVITVERFLASGGSCCRGDQCFGSWCRVVACGGSCVVLETTFQNSIAC